MKPPRAIRDLLIVCCCLGAPIAAADNVDIFSQGGAPDAEDAANGVAASGLSPAEQAALYAELFAAEEAAADSSREELELARHLIDRAGDDELAPIRDHLYRRAAELADDHRRRQEGLEILLAAHQGLHAGAPWSRQMATERIAILEDLMRKVRGPEQLPLIAQLQQLVGENAVNALAARDYAQAEQDYDTLAAIMAKTGDRAGAAEIKQLARAIDDAADRAEDIAELRAEVASDPDAALEVGRYDFALGDDESAAAVLARAGEDGRALLAAVAAAQAAADPALTVGMGELEAIAAAIEAEPRREEAVHRRLFTLGIALRDRLVADAGKIEALRIAAATEGWDERLAGLGPDPLAAVSLAGGVSEAQLLRMGWQAAFDHRSVPGGPYPQNEQLTVSVRHDGVLELRVGKDQLTGLRAYSRELAQHRQVLFRFRIAEYQDSPHLGFSVRGENANDSYRVHGHPGKAFGATTGFQSEFGSIELAPEGEWNDLVFTFDGKRVVAGLNGEDFDPGELREPVSSIGPWIKTRGDDTVVVEFQSILYRD